MAGFFGLFDYTKPGPGIPEDMPPKSKFIVFFEVLGRKFWKLGWLNILYFLISIPILFLLYMVVVGYLSPLIESVSKIQGIKDIKTLQSILLLALTVTFLSGFMFFGIGPTSAGFTYVVRNFAREEHAWVSGDFFEHMKKNIKEGFLAFLIDIIVIIIFGVNMWYYSHMSAQYTIAGIVKYLILFIFLIYMMMHIYVYPMMVTYNLKVRHIYKNAFIFTVLKLPHTFGIFLLLVFVWIIPFLLMIATGAVFVLFLYPLIWISILGLIQNFYTNYVFNIYLNPKIDSSSSGNVDQSENNESSNSEDVIP